MYLYDLYEYNMFYGVPVHQTHYQKTKGSVL